MSYSSSPHPELPGFSAETGELIEGDELPCYLVVVNLVVQHGYPRIIVTPTRRRAPLPKQGRQAVTICWLLSHPDLGWGDAGVVMKTGWESAWGTPQPDGDRYALTVASGPANKVKYAYGLNLTIEGSGIPTIDPEVEYDDDF